MPELARVRAAIAYGLGGPGLGTFYFFPASGHPNSTELLDAVARVRAFYAALASLLTPSTSVLVSGDVQGIDSATGDLVADYATTPPAAVVGTGTSSQMPPATALVVRLRTNAVIGKRLLRGRSYVGPLSLIAGTTTGTPTTAAGTAASAAVTALLSITSTASPVIWHRPKAAGSGNYGLIVGGDAWSSFGSLRSRRD